MSICIILDRIPTILLYDFYLLKTSKFAYIMVGLIPESELLEVYNCDLNLFHHVPKAPKYRARYLRLIAFKLPHVIQNSK